MSIALPDDDAASPSPERPKPVLRVDPPGPDRFISDDFFGQQPVSTTELPDPRPLLANLTRSVLEVLAGARDLAQLARWITADVHTVLLTRAIIAERARRVRGLPTARPVVQIGSVTVSEPRDGVIEAVVMVHTKTRSRAVAIRLEGLDRRWRATSISIL